MQIAFYKGQGQFFDKCVRWKTGSPYSHCELIVDGISYSSSIRDGGVRGKVITFNPESWDIYTVPDNYAVALGLLFDRTKGWAYDWEGILIGELFGTRAQNSRRYYCSEWCGEVFGYNNLSPDELWRRLLADELIR
jgi:hypothetical protein